MPPPIVSHFAQVATNAASAATGTDTSSQQGPPFSMVLLYILPIMGMFYFAFIRPQSQAKKKQEETLRAAKTGDKVVTSSGIHGVITNVKETTVIVRVADNVKLEIEKTHLDKITRPDSDSDKAAAKA
jgi:preprotein translocase subunit YajC